MKIVTLGAALLVWTAPAWAQRPSDRDIAALIERSREKALSYAQSLPDFVASEVIRRYAGESHHGFATRPADTLVVQLRYFQHKEEHKLLLVNGQPTERSFERMEGFVGSGEFGSTLDAIFDPASATSFRWQKWKTVRKQPAAVFTYAVDQARSPYRLESHVDGRVSAATVSYHGTVEVDTESGEALHLEYVADHIPRNLHMDYVATSVDYDFADIGGQRYLLPSRSETEMRGPVEWTKNVMEFREYRKFSADSVVDFGPPK